MKPVETNVSLPSVEEKILGYWKEKDIFQRSMKPESRAVPSGINSS